MPFIPCSNAPFAKGKGFIPNNPVANGEDPLHTSLTDRFEPVDQYTRKIYKVATGDTNILGEHVERLRRMIEARGEYVYLVRRKLDGETCTCYDSITDTIRRKYCLQCWGTRIKKGYELLRNTGRSDGKIIIAAPFADAKVDWEDYGRTQTEELIYWTLPWIPLTNGSTTYSYDWLIRYNNDGTELGRYYIHNVKPSRSLENYVTYQHFTAALATRPTYDHTNTLVRRGDILYEIDIAALDVLEGNLEKGADNK